MYLVGLAYSPIRRCEFHILRLPELPYYTNFGYKFRRELAYLATGPPHWTWRSPRALGYEYSMRFPEYDTIEREAEGNYADYHLERRGHLIHTTECH